MDRSCEVCGGAFAPKRATAKYCGPACKKRAFDRRAAERVAARAESNPQVSEPSERPKVPRQLTDRLTAELEAAGRIETVAGQQALLLARRLEDPETSFGSAAASLSKELREVMAEAMAGVAREGDPVDELRARRERKHLA